MPDDIRTHGGQVQGYRQRVNDAASAAETTLDHRAFGLLNAWMVPTVGLIATATQDGITDQAEDLGETAVTLRTMARNSETTDGNAASLMAGRPDERRPRRRPERPLLALRHGPARLDGLLLRGARQRVLGGCRAPVSRSGSTSMRPSATPSAASSPLASAGSSTTSSRSRAGSTTSPATPRRWRFAGTWQNVSSYVDDVRTDYLQESNRRLDE